MDQQITSNYHVNFINGPASPDASNACTFTDYFMGLIGLYIANYLRKKETAAKNNIHIKFSIVYYLKILKMYFYFFGISGITGGLRHHLFAEYNNPHWSWSITLFFAGSTSVFYFLAPFYLLCQRSLNNSKPLCQKFYKITMVLGLMLGTEEAFYSKLALGGCLLGSIFGNAILMTILVVVNKKAVNNRYLRLKMGKFYLILVILITFCVYYVSIAEGCRNAYAYSLELCPFPDWFNHNAVLHTVLTVYNLVLVFKTFDLSGI